MIVAGKEREFDFSPQVPDGLLLLMAKVGRISAISRAHGTVLNRIHLRELRDGRICAGG
jgi:hypothetical protein